MLTSGAYLGELIGWRGAFHAAGVLALAVTVAMLVLLPKLPGLPAGQRLRLSGVMNLFGNPRVRTGLTVVALLVTGHFAAYTYVRPVLEDVAGASAARQWKST